MAASDSAKDYVHLLLARFNEDNRQVQIYRDQIVDFERNYQSYDMSLLRKYMDFDPDLVILRIGENVGSLDPEVFKLKVNELLDSVTLEGLKTAIIVGPFWRMEDVNLALSEVASDRGLHFLDIQYLSDDPSNEAIGLFWHDGVAIHPCDKGMAAIADAIWSDVDSSFGGVMVQRRVLSENSVPNLEIMIQPNPIISSARIRYNLTQRSAVSLTLYNLHGKIVRELAGGIMSEGTHTVQMEAASLASGIYICELKVDATAKRLKLVLMR